MRHQTQASGAASAPRSYANPETTGGLTPNGTHFVSGTALAAGNSPKVVDPKSPVASAIPLKVSVIGLTPPRLPITLLLLIVLVGQLFVSQPVQAQNRARSLAPQLTPNERRFLWPIDRRLATRLNSVQNPGDRDTWYVLMFRDIAGAETETTTTIHRRAAKVDGAMIVQGRQQAAITVAQFLTKSNTAAQAVAANTPQGSQLNQAAANKLWEYRAFRNQFEAQAFLETLFPPTNSESPGSQSR